MGAPPVITALGIGIIGIGLLVLYAAITGQSVMTELKAAVGVK